MNKPVPAPIAYSILFAPAVRAPPAFLLRYLLFAAPSRRRRPDPRPLAVDLHRLAARRILEKQQMAAERRESRRCNLMVAAADRMRAADSRRALFLSKRASHSRQRCVYRPFPSDRATVRRQAALRAEMRRLNAQRRRAEIHAAVAAERRRSEVKRRLRVAAQESWKEYKRAVCALRCAAAHRAAAEHLASRRRAARMSTAR
jgi:hypothetical protein